VIGRMRAAKTRREIALDAKTRMRVDWEERARRNAFHYIASWKEQWESSDFLRSGEEDYLRLVAPMLKACGAEQPSDLVLELGCGAGRMTGSFARRHKRVIAVDLSAEMLRRAIALHPSPDNILWLRASGEDLAFLKDEAVSFVFSYLVLQHLPNERLVSNYVTEMLRVLRPGGIFLFQFNGSSQPTMNWRGRAIWGAIDLLWSGGMPWLGRSLAALFGMDSAAAGRTWRGAAVSAPKIISLVQSVGGEVRLSTGEETPMAWCCGIKKTGPASVC